VARLNACRPVKISARDQNLSRLDQSPGALDVQCPIADGPLLTTSAYDLTVTAKLEPFQVRGAAHRPKRQSDEHIESLLDAFTHSLQNRTLAVGLSAASSVQDRLRS